MCVPPCVTCRLSATDLVRREAERDAEAASLRNEYAALDAKARQVLAAAEERRIS